MDEGVDPQNMCRHLYGTMGILHQLSKDASEELVLLFQDWMDMVVNECREIIAKEPHINDKELSKRLKIPQSTVKILLERSKN